ncbi:hypothetical protein CUR178_04506 [Leishmania enriettii]|uniref:Amastin-like protein n=1 Tax=Leishmania enriettii TaxID=5663 RepID=A0A836KI47_LEIEN|nr:hypothetical protein CUR178_04506 [Leishmania enriettii]
MPKVTRVKKMFDDISSFSEEDVVDGRAVQHEVKEPPGARSAQHVDPAVSCAPACEAAAAQEIASDDEPSVFVPRLASASLQKAKAESTGEGGPGQVTMVTCVRVSLSPKESPRGAPLTAQLALTPAQLQYPSESLLVQQQSKSAFVGTPSPKRAASGSGFAFSTQATASQQPAWREEVEVAVSLHQAGAEAASAPKGHRKSHRQGAHDLDGKDRNGGAGTTGAKEASPAQYLGRQGVEVVEYSTTRNCEGSYSTGCLPDESGGWEMHEQYTPASMNWAAAASMECSREEYATHGRAHADHLQDPNSYDEDFSFASYIFPRLDPGFARNQGSRASVEAAKAPNVIEKGCAYLMVADIRVASYLVALFLSVMLMTASIPTSQLDVVGEACFTYWGFKNNCDNAAYTIPRPVHPCAFIRDHLGVGAAFSIITLIVYLVNFAAVIIVVCCLTESPHTISFESRIFVGVLGCIGAVTQLISWAVVARIYSSHPCVKEELAYGVGFGLNLSSWVINLLGATLVLTVPSGIVSHHQQRP